MIDDLSGIICMINTRGRVTRVKGWEVQNWRNQGWHVVINPKEEYYPEYDQTLNKPINKDAIKIDDVFEEDMLDMEVLS